VFRTVLYAGLRRGGILGLRWRHVHLADPEGARLEVRETVVYGRAETPKSERAERTIALGPRLADELFQHRPGRRTPAMASGCSATRRRAGCSTTSGTPRR
jgi:hypothetical protein